MKRKFFALFALLLSLTLLCGCAAQTEVDTDETKTDVSATYLARIAELEATLQREREEKYISDIAYKNKIEELEGKLQVGTPPENNTAVEESVFHYRVSDGKAIVTGYEGNANFINIPSQLDGYQVTAIGERAFEGSTPLSVSIPEGVKSIGWFAFYNCTTLVDISIPASVTSIGYAVFDGCASLTIICPDGSYAAQYAESFGLSHLSP